MKKTNVKRVVFLGALCVAVNLASAWYSVTFNDARLVKPMDFSEYRFQIQDLPEILSIIFILAYAGYLFLLLIRSIFAEKNRKTETQTTRRINPKYGLFGFFGLFGFLGFWTYHVDKTVYPFVFFLFFGFFGLFYEGKLSGTFMDERFRENQIKARMKASRTALSIIFFATLVLGQGKFMGNLEYTLIAFVIVVALSLALELFLGEYLLYRYDHDEQIEERGE